MSLFFEELEQLQKPISVHDSQSRVGSEMLVWNNDVLRQAAKPLVDALEGLHQEALSMTPDELELSMQLAIAVNGETPVFKVISLGSKCQIAAKFVWKNDFQLSN